VNFHSPFPSRIAEIIKKYTVILYAVTFDVVIGRLAAMRHRHQAVSNVPDLE
jgi:hypothetical protein